MSIREFGPSFRNPQQTLSEFSKKIEKPAKSLPVASVDKLLLVSQSLANSFFTRFWSVLTGSGNGMTHTASHDQPFKKYLRITDWHGSHHPSPAQHSALGQPNNGTLQEFRFHRRFESFDDIGYPLIVRTTIRSRSDSSERKMRISISSRSGDSHR